MQKVPTSTSADRELRKGNDPSVASLSFSAIQYHIPTGRTARAIGRATRLVREDNMVIQLTLHARRRNKKLPQHNDLEKIFKPARHMRPTEIKKASYGN